MNFRGVEIQVSQRRIPKEMRQSDLHYYELRHADNDWDEPITIEHRVVVNFWGTLEAQKPLQFPDEEPWIDLKPSEVVQMRMASERIAA